MKEEKAAELWCPVERPVSLLDEDGNWQLRNYFEGKSLVSQSIACTNLRPDLVLCSESEHFVHFLEFTVPL